MAIAATTRAGRPSSTSTHSGTTGRSDSSGAAATRAPAAKPPCSDADSTSPSIGPGVRPAASPSATPIPSASSTAHNLKGPGPFIKGPDPAYAAFT